MPFDEILSATNISASGLSAERLRMEVVANNIANAFSTRTPQGGPYRRQEVIFSAVLNDKMRGRSPGRDALRGVEVVGVVDDSSDLTRVFNPGHPDADASGYVSFPHINPAEDMVDLMGASRGYQANIAAMSAVKDMIQRSIDLMR